MGFRDWVFLEFAGFCVYSASISNLIASYKGQWHDFAIWFWLVTYSPFRDYLRLCVGLVCLELVRVFRVRVSGLAY